MGYFKVDLERTGGRGRDKEIAVAVATAGLEDIVGHFLLQRRAWCKDRRMWETVRKGRVLQSWTDYTLGYDCRIFQNVAVQDPRQNSDHLMILGCLCGASPREHLRYLDFRMRLLLRPTGRQTRTQAENIFAELWRAVPKPEKWAARRNLWILAETRRIINKRVSARREPGRYQRGIRRLGRAIQATLKEDRRRWASLVGYDADRLLSRDPPP